MRYLFSNFVVTKLVKRIIQLLSTAVIASNSLSAQLTEYRNWSDQQGREIEAQLINFDATSSVGKFRRSDGYLVDIPLNLLAAEDQALIEKIILQQQSSETQDTHQVVENQSENYIISGLSKKNVDGFIATKEGWEYEIKSLRVKARYKSEKRSAGKQYLKAYYYDRDENLIQVYGVPARLQNSQGNYEDPPKLIGNQTEEAYFPFSNFLEDRDWNRVIVVFGDTNEASAEIYPSGDISKYAFPERALIFGEPLKREKAETDEAPTRYHITSARKKRFNATAWVDGRWQDGAKGILVEVEIKGALPRNNYFLKAHFYDAADRKILTVKRPAEIESDGDANVYTRLPKFAKENDEKSAFFPFEERIEASDWRKAVIVFGDKQSVDAAIIGGDSFDLEKLAFDEKVQYEARRP